MKIDKIRQLLDELGVHIVDKNSVIYQSDKGQEKILLQNHYAIREKGEGRWGFCFVQIERKESPEYRSIKEFNDRREALIYFFLDRLRDNFLSNKINSAMDFSIVNLDAEKMIKMLERYDVPIDYFSTKKDFKAHSVICYEENTIWYNGFIDKNAQMLGQSPPLADCNTAFFSTFRRVYLLYLFFQYIEKREVEKFLEYTFSDAEIAQYLKYDI